jgi:hypothetical protein
MSQMQLTERNKKGSGRVLNEVLSQHLHGGTDENYKNPQVRTTGDLIESRTEHLRSV